MYLYPSFNYAILFSFSIMFIGLGFFLCILGILFFILIFNCKLHTLMEPKQNRRKMFLSKKFLIALFLSICFGITCIFIPLIDDILRVHLIYFLQLVSVHIILPIYYIKQNPNMQLYLSVYHHQPPPVLPWQLPKNFEPNSVKLKTM